MQALALALLAAVARAQTVARGPYLDAVTHDAATVRVATILPGQGAVRYRALGESESQVATGSPNTREHVVVLSNLQPNTRYEYRIERAGDADAAKDGEYPFFFETYPRDNERHYPVTLWAIGDAGEGSPAATATLQAFLTHAGPALPTWHATLALGDNAYQLGTAAEYDAKFFRVFGPALAIAPVSATIGNHEVLASNARSESGPYFDRFGRNSMRPRGASDPAPVAKAAKASVRRAAPPHQYYSRLLAGRRRLHQVQPAASKLYHAFSIGRGVRVLSLDSQYVAVLPDGDPRLAAFAAWLSAELDDARENADWIVVYHHHPLYSHGHHNTDFDSDHRYSVLRARLAPVYDSFGVDLVLSGHSHAYERGTSAVRGGKRVGDGGRPDCLNTGLGTAYVVAGSASKTNAAPLDHPLMGVGRVSTGSVVITAESARRLSVRFLSNGGAQDHDAFALEKGPGACRV